MDTPELILLGFVIALLVAPFAALRAVSHFRKRRLPPAKPEARSDAEKEKDDSEGFW